MIETELTYCCYCKKTTLPPESNYHQECYDIVEDFSKHHNILGEFAYYGGKTEINNIRIVRPEYLNIISMDFNSQYPTSRWIVERESIQND